MHRRPAAPLILRAIRAGLTVSPKQTVVVLLVGFAILFSVGALVVRLLTPATFCNTNRSPPPDHPIEWSFSFVDDDLDALSDVRRELESRGFSFRDVGQGPCSHCASRQLRVTQTAHHSAESFRELQRGLCETATRHGLEMYWGALPTDRRYWPEYPHP